jgi:hypothetical protein
MRIYASIFLFLLFSATALKAQDAPVQTIYGIVTDGESKKPLAGVLVLTVSNEQLNAFTD